MPTLSDILFAQEKQVFWSGCRFIAYTVACNQSYKNTILTILNRFSTLSLRQVMALTLLGHSGLEITVKFSQ